MCDRICPKCNHEFKFPSLLKIHFRNVYHCLLSEDEIIKYFNRYNNNNNINSSNTISENNNITESNLNNNLSNTIVDSNINDNSINNTHNINKCSKCLKEFKNIKAFKRHTKETICGKSQSTLTSNNNPISNEEIVNFIKKLSPKLAQNIEKLIENQNNNTPQSAAQITSNSNNNTINNIINNITNNNTINIQHINPFGFEDIRVIPIPEMKKILASGDDAGFEIIKAIYNKIENKNFYKPNMSKSEVAFLNTDFNLTVYKSKQFCDALFDRCIALLHYMLFLCKSEYTKNRISSIYTNIEYIETTMRTEIYDKQLQNIIESEFRNNNIDNKDRIKKFIKDIKSNNDTKDQSKTLINNVLTLKDKSDTEYKTSISEEELNNALGDPKVLLGLIKPELLEEFKFKRFEETRFYKFWKDRIKNTRIYITNSKTATIGDSKYMKLKEQKIEAMLNLIKLRVDNMKHDEYIDLNVEGFTINNISRNDDYEEDDD